MISKTYYGHLIAELCSAKTSTDTRIKGICEAIYDTIRDKAGLEFEDYSDAPERWLAWMIANDTEDKEKAMRTRDRNLYG